MKKVNLATTVGTVLALYHLLTVMADAEQCALNLRRWRAQPNQDNFLKLLLAEGVFLKDLRWLL